MAALYKHVSTDICVLYRGVFSGICSNFARHQGVRCLYSEAALGVDNYVRTRERVQQQFVNIAEKFRGKMLEFSEASATNMIFTEDLKNMLHLAESKPEDIDLILKMMKRFNQQHKSLRFGSFIFGPVVMRMFYHLNKPDAALAAFNDPDLEGFFDQLVSYQILMDLLFKNKKYNEVLQIFQIVKERQIQGAKYPKNTVVLALATYYKMNTPESLKQMTDLWADLQTVGHIPMRRAATFAAALAINQNAPHIALEILSGIRQQNYVTVRNLKVSALADIGRPEDALPILRTLLEVDDPLQKQTVSKDSIQKLKESINRSEKEDFVREFEQLEKRLVGGSHISEQLQDDYLCTEIVGQRFPPQQGQNRRMLEASFNQQRRPIGVSRQSRPSLSEMY